MLYAHWRDVPADSWRWKNFQPYEIACKGDGSLLVDEAALDKLQALRSAINKPLRINSGYRSAAHNKAVGGSPTSQHLLGRAFDIDLSPETGVTRQRLTALAKAAGFTGIGQYDGFVHVDTGPTRAWDHRGKR